MSSVIATLGAFILGSLAILVGTVFVGILKAGPGEIGLLRRKGYGLRPWVTGSLPRSGRGTTASELEGLEMKAVDGRLVRVRRTRTPSSEVV